jgi:hypothetical protein
VLHLKGGPNIDTVYVSGLLDLKPEPLILHKPAVEPERYYGIVFTNANYVVETVVGTGLLGGNDEHDFLLVGPHYSAELPDGYTILRFTTNHIHLLIRIREFDNKPNDYAHVLDILKTSYIRPISTLSDDAWIPENESLSYEISNKGRDKARTVSLEEFLNVYNSLVEDDPPEEADKSIVTYFEKYNIGVHRQFSLDIFPEAWRDKLNGIPRDYAKKFSLDEVFGAGSSTLNNWDSQCNNDVLRGGDYKARAKIGWWGSGVNPTYIALYYSALTDKDGNALDGVNNYKIHFEEGSLPPILYGGFWSLIPYGGRELLVIPNKLNRYRLGDYADFHYNRDGSLDIYFQKDDPGEEKTANWLPVAEGSFSVVLRIYLPDNDVIDAGWIPPYIERI